MTEAKKLAEDLRERLETTFEVNAVDEAVSVSYIQARRRLAEIRPSETSLRVTLSAEFADQPGLEGEALTRAGKKELEARISALRARGYRERNSEQQPAASSEPESEETPVYVTALEWGYGSVDALVEELTWLAEQEKSRR